MSDTSALRSDHEQLLESESSFQQFVSQNLRWNFSVNLIDIVFITAGLSLISRETVMPIFVSNLTDSKLAIGLIPAIYSFFFYIPQLFSANFSERLRYKKPFVMLLGGLGERVPYLLMAIAIWMLAMPAPTVTLALFFLLLAATAVTNGYATPAWFDMVAKVIPVQVRGIWSGIGHGVGALVGIILLGIEGWYFGVVDWLMKAFEFPNNFALLFGLAAVATGISFIGLALNREPPSPIVKKQVSMRSYLRQLPTVLRNDANYSRFLLSRTAIHLGAMATGFFAVYGKEAFSDSAGGLAALSVQLTVTLVASKALMNLVWGVVGDRLGHKMVLTWAAFVMAIAALIAWTTASYAWLLLVMFLVGAALAADEVSGLNIILEFCKAEDRPTYIGLTNTLLAPVVTIAPLIGGWLAGGPGYQTLFGVALMVSVIGGFMMLVWVKEPRYESGE